MPACNTLEQNAAVNRAKNLIAVYEDMAELVRLGAYRRGSDPTVDEAIHFQPSLDAFLAQEIDETVSLDTCYENLYQILGMNNESLEQRESDTDTTGMGE